MRFYCVYDFLRPVFYCLGRKKTYKSKKKRVAKSIYFANALF